MKTLALLAALLSHVLFAPVARAAIDKTFDSNGVKIRYVIEGEGQPVVLIHGWMGDATMWGRDAAGNPKLDASKSPGFQVIALDCRGHGQSDKPHDPAKYGPEMALDIVRLLDHLKIEKAHLVGYSSGTFLAGYIVAHHPERVLSVVYAAQAPILESANKVDAEEIEVFASAAEKGEDLGAYILAVMPKERTPTPEQATAMAKYMFAGKDVKAFAAAGRSFKHLGVPKDQLNRPEIPTLFIHGSDEGEAVKSRVAAVKQLVPHAQFKLIEGGTHITTLAKPEFGEALMAFLRGVPRADRDRFAHAGSRNSAAGP